MNRASDMKGEAMDLIDRRQAIDAVDAIGHIATMPDGDKCIRRSAVKYTLSALPSAQPEPTTEIQEILNYLDTALHPIVSPDNWNVYAELHDMISKLPPAQPEKEIPKRVLWSGWKGVRDTRYKCPNCKKPVRNTDIYCHRCGQKLMFPNIDFTPYVEGKKQELIVRWDDERHVGFSTQ